MCVVEKRMFDWMSEVCLDVTDRECPLLCLLVGEKTIKECEEIIDFAGKESL